MRLECENKHKPFSRLLIIYSNNSDDNDSSNTKKNAHWSRAVSPPHCSPNPALTPPQINNRNEDGRMPSEIDIALLCSLSLKKRMCVSESVCAFLAFDFRAAAATLLPYSFALFQYINLAFLLCCSHQVAAIYSSIELMCALCAFLRIFQHFWLWYFVCFSFPDLLGSTHARTPSQNLSL